METTKSQSRKPKTYGKISSAKQYWSSNFEKMSPELPKERSTSRQHPNPLSDQAKQMAEEAHTPSIIPPRNPHCQGGGALHTAEDALSRSFADIGLGSSDGGTHLEETSALTRPEVEYEVLAPKAPRTSPVPSSTPSILGPKCQNQLLGPSKEYTKSKHGAEEAKSLPRTTFPKQKETGRVRGNSETHKCASGGQRRYATTKARDAQSERELRSRKLTDIREEKATARTAYLKPLLLLCSDGKEDNSPKHFGRWTHSFGDQLCVKKIAEASYSEVYRLNYTSSPAPGLVSKEESIAKVMALRPENGEKEEDASAARMCSVGSIVAEVEILMRMNGVTGFTKFKGFHLMSGGLPAEFVHAWKVFRQERGGSEFPDPRSTVGYPDDQIWVILEMENAGTELEDMRMQNAQQVLDIFLSVAITLARGEIEARFEHRDLHLSNICVQIDPNEGHIDGGSSRSKYRTTLIDYTLSRVEMKDEVKTKNGCRANRVAWSNLELDPTLFRGTGLYQYQIYRLMRTSLLRSQHGMKKPDWKKYCPTTNVLWLHHLLTTLSGRLDNCGGTGGSKTKSDLNHSSATEREIRRKLRLLEATLRPQKSRSSGLNSAKDFIDWTLGSAIVKSQDFMTEDVSHGVLEALEGVDKRRDSSCIDWTEGALAY
ncbi:MAG: hypothetical protein M1837_003987 [Sclerophora amabilis]|nr:MAG: hypothetical protein M1837_003987 [Sclerophora amabilis]